MPWPLPLLVLIIKKNMLKKLSLLIFFLYPFFVLAQNENINAPEVVEIVPVVAEAGVDKNVAVGRNVFFDASGSTGPTDKTLTYEWDFGDGYKSDGIDATHIYKKPGTYRVALTVSDGEQQDKDSIIVSVNRDLIVLITDSTIDQTKIKEKQDFALTQETLLVNINVEAKEAEYLAAAKLANKLLENKDDLRQSDIIISWTSGNLGLNALAEMGKVLGEQVSPELSFSQKGVVALTDQPLGASSRIAQGTFNLLAPEYIILTPPANLEKIIEAKTSDKVVNALAGTKFQLIGVHSQRALSQIGPFNFLSYAVNYLVNQGVALNTIFLILALPLVATIIAFARQIIGVKAFGIYVPSILALSFLATGIKYGLVIFFVLLFVGTITRLAAKRLKLLYLPRMAIVLTVVSLAIFFLFIIGAYFHKAGFIALSVFPILVIIVMTEKFIEVQIEKGPWLAIRLTVETLILSIISYYLVSWETLRTIILGYPEIILLAFLLNYLFGRFTGLRVLEYFRFRKILKHVEVPKK